MTTAPGRPMFDPVYDRETCATGHTSFPWSTRSIETDRKTGLCAGCWALVVLAPSGSDWRALLSAVALRWKSDYHCCAANSSRFRKPPDPPHDEDCPLARALAALGIPQ